jgi:hypothetical protein
MVPGAKPEKLTTSRAAAFAAAIGSAVPTTIATNSAARRNIAPALKIFDQINYNPCARIRG